MIRSRFPKMWTGILGALLTANLTFASPTETPEQETLRISRTLRPISDSEWTALTEDHVDGRYEITRGDTLYDISKRLFGDPRYWPKLWAINNSSILNPHLIKPGNRIIFTPGSGSSLPTVAIEADASDVEKSGKIDSGPAHYLRKRRSQEWRNLPAQQWEASQIAAEEAARHPILQMGDLDRVAKNQLSRELPAFVSTRPLDPLGKITASPSEFTYLQVGTEILIDAQEDVKQGETYTLTSAPNKLEKKDDKARQGYAYRVLGEVQITAPEGDQWLGRITNARSLIDRGTILVPLLPRLKTFAPVAAPAPLDGLFYLDRNYSIYLSAQGGFGFVNLGSEDGLQEGMIFECYQPKDPNTNKKFANPETFRTCDMKVVQVSEEFSTVLILGGPQEIPEGTPVRLLTDVSAFLRYGSTPGGHKGEPEPPAPEEQEPPAPEAPPTAPVAEPPAPEAAPTEVPAPEPSQEAVPVPPPAEPPAPQAAPPAAPEPPPAAAPAAPAPRAAPPNELDSFEGDEKLNSGDQKELKQLENFKGQPAAPPENIPPPPPAQPEAPPAPTEAQPPPPNPSPTDAPDKMLPPSQGLFGH